VVTGGTVYVQAVKNAITTIPIVMTGPGADPVEQGLIESLAYPGANVTGITNLSRDLGGKRLELLKEVAPKISRVGILQDPTNQAHVYEMKEILPPAARALKLTLQPWEIKAAEDFEKVLASLRTQVSHGLYPLGGPLFNGNQKIFDFALKNRLPTVSSAIGDVDAGVLMYYGADFEDSYRQVAWYIDKILKGAKPADLPVQQPMKFQFVINLKTAKQINLAIPQWTLMKADRVIR
jgi:putative ABC transport system substrate-binding protein